MRRHYTFTDMRVLKQLSIGMIALALAGASFGSYAASASNSSRTSAKATHPKAPSSRRPARVAAFEPASQSFGYAAGLHSTSDPLALRSGTSARRRGSRPR